MSESDESGMKSFVRNRYSAVARGEEGCCETSCCPPADHATDGSAGRGSRGGKAAVSASLGYDEADLASVPESANLGLGCGNPISIASLSEGETVLDLGSGAGLDCFLAAKKVAPRGKVIGVDMTADMIDRARAAAEKGGFMNVEFRLGEIESLPVADGTVDVVLSNCVLNLSPDKDRVLREVYRVLKPGGRLAISDLVSDRPVPEELRENPEAVAACLPTFRETYLDAYRRAGFDDVSIAQETPYPTEYLLSDAGVQSFLTDRPELSEEVGAFAGSLVGAHFEASKPK